MTLATRCSACGTSFRVVQDQLKVSGGWVRCGRCNEVFNAIEGLYEVGSPMAEPARRAPTPTPTPAPAPVGLGQATPAMPAPVPAPVDDATAVGSPVAQNPASGAVREQPRVMDEEAPAITEPVARLEPAEPEALPAPDTEQALPSASPDDAELLTPSPADDWRSDDWPTREPTPSFLVAAARAERKHQPRSRLVWGSLTLLLLALLGLQTAVAYRDVIAARWPRARPALQQACGWLDCRVEPLRHIAALSVEASGLQQVGTASVYTLSVALRNRSDIVLMLPALDLVLTDSQGRTIARKVLTMADLGRPARSLDALAETTGQVTLGTGGQRVAGYTIEIFYP